MKKNIFLLAAAGLSAVHFISCKNDNTPPVQATAIHLDSNAQVGTHIVDKDGKSLYYFANDVNSQSNCTGACLTNWPVFFADSTATFSDGLSAADFATITTGSGERQTTFKGWPLYYYSPAGVQEAAGQTTGEGVNGIWFVAKPNYSITIANYQLTGANGINYLSTYAPGDGLTVYFCDQQGRTLYSFARDSALNNNFTVPDFSNNAIWPIYETENITVPTLLDKTLFAVMDFNGRKQLTYKGWPLYYYGADNLVRGSNKGITIPPSQPPGAIWPVVTKNVVAAPQ